MPKKRTSLDTLDIGSQKTESEEAVQTPSKPQATSRIQKACYFDPMIVVTIEAFVLDQKQQGNRGASFNKCVNEGLELLMAEKGLEIKKQ